MILQINIEYMLKWLTKLTIQYLFTEKVGLPLLGFPTPPLSFYVLVWIAYIIILQ